MLNKKTKKKTKTQPNQRVKLTFIIFLVFKYGFEEDKIYLGDYLSF